MHATPGAGDSHQHEEHLYLFDEWESPVVVAVPGTSGSDEKRPKRFAVY